MALKKLKKGLKKAAKAIVPIGAAMLAAKALGRRKQNKIYNQEEGGDLSRGSLPMSKRQVVGLDFEPGTDLSGIDRLAAAGGADKMMAKGGRVTKSRGAGIAKRGFGRAFKGGRIYIWTP